MVAVEQPRADCGHVAALTQQCGRCLRWCCPECYFPWTALACGDCRVEARAAASKPGGSAVQAFEAPVIAAAVEAPAEPHCRDRGRGRSAGPRRHREREPADVHTLAARVADLERRLSELRGL